MEREAFLANVRERLAGVEVPPLPTDLPRTFASGDGRTFERFAEELAKVGGEARLAAPDEIDDLIAEVANGLAGAVVADVGPYRDAVVAGLGRAGCAVLAPSREEAAAADLGITGADLAVASTGSVLVRMGPGTPRSASLLPPVHLAIVRADRVVPGFEELFAELPELARDAAQTVLITGASRTGDIELTLVRGVHGPIKVVVLVITA